MKILIFGASGSGTTTLGKALAQKTASVHLDVDDYYWKLADPPFQQKVPLIERNNKLNADFNKYDNVIVSGSMVSWGEEWQSRFDLAIFISLDNQIRMEHLRKREKQRYGIKLSTNLLIKQNSEAFLKWADQYDDPDFKGRSLKVHQNWMKSLSCTVVSINGAISTDKQIEMVLQEIKV